LNSIYPPSLPNFELRITAKEDTRALTSLRLAQATQRHGSELIQKVIEIRATHAGWIVVLEWIEGETLKDANRSALPDFFYGLGQWHLRNRTDRPLQSSYTLQSYAETRRFLADETMYHLERMAWADRYSQCMTILEPLQDAHRTVLHGDVHPGNILATNSGFRLLDPEFMRVGPCLYDLDYLEYDVTAATEDGWWRITDQAEASALAYFRAVGLPLSHLQRSMRAVHLATLLASYSNSLVSGSGDRQAIRSAVDDLLTRQTK
jgi:Ser/Thr protein kinase RdoA (MazF antagonist)